MIGLALLLTAMIYFIVKGVQMHYFVDVGMKPWRAHGIYAIRLAYTGYRGIRTLPAKIIDVSWARFKKTRRGKQWQNSRYVAAWRILQNGKPQPKSAPKKMSADEFWRIIKEAHLHTPQRVGDMAYFWTNGETAKESLNLKTGKFVKVSKVELIKREGQVRPSYRAEVPEPPPLEGTVSAKQHSAQRQ